MEGRLPAHLEVSGLIRIVESQGGFASVLNKGERDAGTILILTMYRGDPLTLYERMPQLDGSRKFIAAKRQNPENPQELAGYVTRRASQDPDIWVIEADVADEERFIASIAR